jgi:hypothetical protein
MASLMQLAIGQVMASLMQLAIVRATSDEGGGDPPRGAQYRLDGSRPAGLIVQVYIYIYI